jgi:hypothetical protein
MTRTQGVILAACAVVEAANFVLLGVIPVHVVTVLVASWIVISLLFRVIFPSNS